MLIYQRVINIDGIFLFEGPLNASEFWGISHCHVNQETPLEVWKTIEKYPSAVICGVEMGFSEHGGNQITSN